MPALGKGQDDVSFGIIGIRNSGLTNVGEIVDPFRGGKAYGTG